MIFILLYKTNNKMKLVIDEGHWATKDNSMIFGNIIWLCSEDDVNLYHLIDDNRNEIILGKSIKDYIIYD